MGIDTNTHFSSNTQAFTIRKHSKQAQAIAESTTRIKKNCVWKKRRFDWQRHHQAKWPIVELNHFGWVKFRLWIGAVHHAGVPAVRIFFSCNCDLLWNIYDGTWSENARFSNDLGPLMQFRTYQNCWVSTPFYAPIHSKRKARTRREKNRSNGTTTELSC